MSNTTQVIIQYFDSNNEVNLSLQPLRLQDKLTNTCRLDKNDPVRARKVSNSKRRSVNLTAFLFTSLSHVEIHPTMFCSSCFVDNRDVASAAAVDDSMQKMFQ